MTWYPLIKSLHIVSSTVLFGTGAGIAFFFVRAQRTGNSKIIAAVGRDVVLADCIFTATAVILQPVTGVALALTAGYPLSTPWLAVSMVLYALIGCCWLPAVRLQIRMRDLAIDAAAHDLHCLTNVSISPVNAFRSSSRMRPQGLSESGTRGRWARKGRGIPEYRHPLPHR